MQVSYRRCPVPDQWLSCVKHGLFTSLSFWFRLVPGAWGGDQADNVAARLALRVCLRQDAQSGLQISGFRSEATLDLEPLCLPLVWQVFSSWNIRGSLQPCCLYS